jgi:hypothetical protein
MHVPVEIRSAELGANFGSHAQIDATSPSSVLLTI